MDVTAPALLLSLIPLAPVPSAAAPAVYPRAIESLVEQGQDLLRQGGPDAARRALELFETHVDRYPDDPQGYEGAATALVRLRRSPEAVSLLREAHERVPRNAPVLFNLAATLHNQSLYDEAIVYWRALRDLAEVDVELARRPEWARFLGQAASELGFVPEAIEAYERAVALEPGRAATRAGLAHELLVATRFEEALPHLERVVEQEPRNARYHYQLGWALLKLGRDEAAEKELLRATELDPRIVDAHVKLGTLYARQQRSSDAVLAYRNAVRNNALSVEALHALTRLLSSTGDEAGAAEVRKRYEEVSAMADERTEALREHLRRVAAEPDNPAAYEAVARFHLELGDADAAEPWLMRLLWRDPDNEQAILNLSTILALRGDLDAALLEVEKVLARDADHVAANLRKGRILCSQRKWQEALPYLERMLPHVGDKRAEVETLIQAARAQARR